MYCGSANAGNAVLHLVLRVVRVDLLCCELGTLDDRRIVKGFGLTNTRASTMTRTLFCLLLTLGLCTVADAWDQSVSDFVDDSECAACCPCCDHDQSASTKLLESLGIDVNGMLWHSVNTNSRNPANFPDGTGSVPGGLFLYRSDEYMFNWLGVRASRATNTGGCGWDVGGALHAVYGTDYFSLQSRGLEQEGDGTNRWNSDSGAGLIGGLHGLAIPEMYLEVARNNATAKIGKFFHPLGFSRYEPNQNSIANTRSYGAIYGEFATVTGLQLDWQASSQLTLTGALHRGDANWEDNNDRLSAYLGFNWISTDRRTELRYMFDVGREDDAGLDDQYIHAIVFQQRFCERWLYLFHNNLGWVENAALAGGDANWYSIEQQLAYEISSKLVVGIRYEWFDDVDGSRVAPTPGRGIYHLMDVGGTYRMSSYLWLRPELRWEWFDADAGVAAQGPFGNGTQRSQFVASFSVFTFF